MMKPAFNCMPCHIAYVVLKKLLPENSHESIILSEMKNKKIEILIINEFQAVLYPTGRKHIKCWD